MQVVTCWNFLKGIHKRVFLLPIVQTSSTVGFIFFFYGNSILSYFFSPFIPFPNSWGVLCQFLLLLGFFYLFVLASKNQKGKKRSRLEHHLAENQSCAVVLHVCVILHWRFILQCHLTRPQVSHELGNKTKSNSRIFQGTAEFLHV